MQICLCPVWHMSEWEERRRLILITSLELPSWRAVLCDHSMSFRLVFIVLLATNSQVGQVNPLSKLMNEDFVPVNQETQVKYETFTFANVFVLVSWISFLIPPFCIEGRLAVLMTSLLVEANIYNNTHSREVRRLRNANITFKDSPRKPLEIVNLTHIRSTFKFSIC